MLEEETEIEKLRNILLEMFDSVFEGNKKASELILLNIISSIFLRKNFDVFGNFSVRVMNANKELIYHETNSG